MALLEIGLFLTLLGFLIYKWATATFKTFEQRGIPYEKPFPLAGNILDVMLGKDSTFQTLLNFYRRNRQHKIAGFYNFRTPNFVINDPECVKKIAVKDADFFPNHAPVIDVEDEPLFEGMLNVMRDQRWKHMRNTLTPVFTASKMRTMFPLMNECFDECLKKLRAHASSSSGGAELELKVFFNKLSNDVIASTAFGLKVNSFEHGDNEFFRIGSKITDFKGMALFRLFLATAAPWAMKLLRMKLFDPAQTDYFIRLVLDAMKYREEHNIVRHDMIQLLLETKKDAAAQKWTDMELVSQCFIFFFAAFDNNANLISLTCHTLMENPDVQEKLHEEAKRVEGDLQGAPLHYDALNSMKYMDLVVSETLRQFTLAPQTDRYCAKDYKLTDEEGNFVFEFKKGDIIWIPIVGFHWDERYFPEPEKFDPERFSEANKHNIKPLTYVPFGMGQRMCIGNRYALMQAKAMLYHIVLNFKLERSPKTAKNLLTELHGIQTKPKSGYWMNLIAR